MAQFLWECAGDHFWLQSERLQDLQSPRRGRSEHDPFSCIQSSDNLNQNARPSLTSDEAVLAYLAAC